MAEFPFFSVIIVGAGPTGLAMGNLLGMYGIDTLLLEDHAGLSQSQKAIAIDDEGLRVLQAMGLHHAMIERLLYGMEAHYHSGTTLIARVAPTSRPNGFPLISTFLQPELETVLLNGLQRYDCVTAQFQRVVEGFEQHNESVIVTTRAPDGSRIQYECAYLLACDGGKSTLRRALNIPMRGSTYAQRWLVIDSAQDSDPSTIIRFFCNPRRPAVAVPGPGQSRRWEFMLLPGEQDADLLQDERVNALIQSAGGTGGTSDIGGTSGTNHPHITRKVIYTFHALIAATFSRGRVFLLGDAAHLLPPFGGQGMNCGLRDAHNLAWKLLLVLQGLASPALLESYTLERQAHTAQLLAFSKFAGNIVMTTRRPIALFRDTLLRLLYTVPFSRTYLTEMRIKPQPRYKRGFLLSWKTPANRKLAGSMLPQPTITAAGGKKLLLDGVLGSGFSLLRLHDHPQKAFANLHNPYWKRLGVQFVAIQKDGSGFPFNDPQLYVLVRPDRYIYGVFREGQEEQFLKELRNDLAGTLKHLVEPRSRSGEDGDQQRRRP
ncbi:MAG TPA: FAD-dependent monooxygenase [Ktedonobacteraceae bacterium]|nr:FAD-dependent monooxygenase [Ktedonobacteraceae bacterium]